MGYNPNFRGSAATASKTLQSTFVNATGGTLSKSVAVYTNTSGQVLAVDVSSETSSLAIVGVCNEDIPSAATGVITSAGRLQNISNSFAIGDAVYVGSTGLLTNVKPDIGVGGFVAGDFVIFVGVVVKNEFNPALKDLQLMISVVGQL